MENLRQQVYLMILRHPVLPIHPTFDVHQLIGFVQIIEMANLIMKFQNQKLMEN